MNSIRVLSLLTTYFSLLYAAPTVSNSPRAAAGSISSQCTNIEFRKHWIVADCLTGEDDTTRIQSASYLAGKIENRRGVLEWKVDGFYHMSCQDCKISADAQLSCVCKGPSFMNASINLDEHISVYNGHLLSNLHEGPVVPPSTSSKYPIPSDFRIRFGGNTTCPGSDGPGTDFCRKQINGCSDTARTDLNNTAWQYDGPVQCLVPVIYFPQYHYQFEVLRAVGEGAWVLEGFTNEACEGNVAYTLEPEEMGKCNVMQSPIKALRIRPAFNGDPN